MAGGGEAAWPKGHLKQSPSSAGLDVLTECRPVLASSAVSQAGPIQAGHGRGRGGGSLPALQGQAGRLTRPGSALPALCPASLPLLGLVIVAARTVPSPSLWVPGTMLARPTLHPHPRWTVGLFTHLFYCF